jgi:hypothetical protein
MPPREALQFVLMAWPVAKGLAVVKKLKHVAAATKVS